MFPTVTGLVTFKAISSLPNLKSALPVRVSAPKFTFLSDEKVSTVSAEVLPTAQAPSELTEKLSLRDRLPTKFSVLLSSLAVIFIPPEVPLSLTCKREIFVLSLIDSKLMGSSSIKLLVLLNVPPPDSLNVWLPISNSLPEYVIVFPAATINSNPSCKATCSSDPEKVMVSCTSSFPPSPDILTLAARVPVLLSWRLLFE